MFDLVVGIGFATLLVAGLLLGAAEMRTSRLAKTARLARRPAPEDDRSNRR